MLASEYRNPLKPAQMYMDLPRGYGDSHGFIIIIVIPQLKNALRIKLFSGIIIDNFKLKLNSTKTSKETSTVIITVIAM